MILKSKDLSFRQTIFILIVKLHGLNLNRMSKLRKVVVCGTLTHYNYIAEMRIFFIRHQSGNNNFTKSEVVHDTNREQKGFTHEKWESYKLVSIYIHQTGIG